MPPMQTLHHRVYNIFEKKKIWNRKKEKGSRNCELVSKRHKVPKRISAPLLCTCLLEELDNVLVALLLGGIQRCACLDVGPLGIGAGLDVQSCAVLQHQLHDADVVEGTSISGKMHSYKGRRREEKRREKTK